MSNSYRKEVISHNQFYIARFIKQPDLPFLIFIHGGPGYNCGIIEYLIECESLFNSLKFNIILYDQRNCGRSMNFPETVLHNQNVNDLEMIYDYLKNNQGIVINGFIGHSYGAKILFDFYKIFKMDLPSVFIATASLLLTPRLNNLTHDLIFLKKTNINKYNEILKNLNELDLNKLWALTEELAPIFKINTERNHMYWADLDWYQKICAISEKIDLPINSNTFVSVRKDIYSTEDNLSVNIQSLDVPFLWINGFHDVIINGSDGMLSKDKNITMFYKSSHYPHIEENNRFNEIINQFFNEHRC